MDNNMLAELDAVVRLMNSGCRPDEYRCAAANFLRANAHHIANMVKRMEAAERDAAAYRQLVAGIDAEQLVAASQKHGDALGVLKDAKRYRYIKSAPTGTVLADFKPWHRAYFHWSTRESLDTAIDAAIDATQEGEG